MKYATQRQRKILVQRYGDPNRILREYRKQLKALPKVKPHDTLALRKFQTFAIKYRSASNFDPAMQSTDVIQLLHAKLFPEQLEQKSIKDTKKSIKRSPS